MAKPHRKPNPPKQHSTGQASQPLIASPKIDLKYTILVYGTLRKGIPRHDYYIGDYLKSGEAEFIKETTIKNFKLYFNYYPLLFPTDVPTDTVVVELYKVTEDVFEAIRSMEEDFCGSPYRSSMIQLPQVGWVCAWVMNKLAFLEIKPQPIPSAYKGDFVKFFNDSTSQQFA